ncbi:unnamed protein product [Symbiodinium sp. CCMP2592]|nr:unnamed protein product [Symbiodinium sp. CCMP2592]
MQIGGRKGQPVQIATHAIRAFQKACVDRKRSWAILFVDLREAFHRVVRPLIHGGSLSDEHLAGIIKEIGLPTQSIHRLYEYAREQSLIQEAGASTWTSQVMREFMEDSWVTYGDCPQLASVRAGTRPGDNLADLVFTFLFAEILHRVREQFQRRGLSVHIPWNPEWLCRKKSTAAAATCSPVDATWMDDLAVILTDATAQGLLAKLKAATCVTLEECLKAALLPNLRAGKTEALVALYGPGSNTLAKEVFRGKLPQLPLDSSLWPEASLGLASCMQRAFNKHRRQVFASPIVRIAEKAILFTSLIESTLYYGAGTWSGLRPADIARLQSHVVNMARSMLSNGRKEADLCHDSHHSILAAARIPTVSTSLHVERLRHFKATVLKATDELWSLLHHEAAWIDTVQDSLGWLQERHRCCCSDSPPWADWDFAVGFIRTSPEAWKRTVNRAKYIATLEELWQAELNKFKGLAFRAFLKAGACLPSNLPPRQSAHEVCEICGVVFDDLRAWSHHAFKRHGRLNPVRRLAQGTQCAVCLAHFRSNKGLCNHLEYARRCRHALINQGFDCIAELGTGSRKFDSGARVLLPSVRAQGPLLQWNHAPAIDEQHLPSERILRDLEALFCHDVGTCVDWSAFVDRLQSIFKGECLQQSRLKATAEQWTQQLHHTLDQDDDWNVQWVSWHLRAARLLQEVDFVEWLGNEGCTPSLVTSTFRDAETLTPWLDFSGVIIPTVPAPVQFGFCFSAGAPKPQWLHCRAGTDKECFACTDWADAAGEDKLVFLSGAGLRGSFSLPFPLRSFASISDQLTQLRLLSDLVRGAFFLWTSHLLVSSQDLLLYS